MEPKPANVPDRAARTKLSVEHRLKRWRNIGFYTDVDMGHLLPGQQRQIVEKAVAHAQVRWPFRVAGPLLILAWIAAFSLTGFLHLKFFVRFQTPLPLIVTGWLSFVLTIAIVIYALSRVVRHLLRPHIWRALENLCSTCGYDLTGNTSGVCPECGREIERGPGPERQESDAHPADKGAKGAR